ncbi:ribonuclease III [Macrococcus sp. DPC7161]|uniref:ribonuclease III n=1 Tax=Macrococcus sp. DPC7161 TaxID=2507060 RepID=UPI00100A5FFA|nr:ribonuclease III [Macrococcus sp. DPC7161]RXK18960.1 ribonuclease III [Macrococcus sp. DPC7161]
MTRHEQIINKYQIKLNEKLAALNIQPNQTAIYIQAFSHSSFINDFKLEKGTDNERLEFLGDAVLELVVSQYLYRNYPDLPEGKLTKLRASIVCEPSLVTFAQLLNFDQMILLGRGEEKTGGRKRPSLIADVFEAFVGALYLDQGMDAIHAFFNQFIFPNITNEVLEGILDYKTHLQELIHKESKVQVDYILIDESGPAHFKSFTSQVKIGDEICGEGTGRTKKESEQSAAKNALKLLLGE